MTTQVTPELLRTMPLPTIDDAVDKNARGKVLIAGSSPTAAGAVILSGLAAFRSGAGKVTLAVPEVLAVPIAIRFPEAGVHGFAATPEGDPVEQAARQIAQWADTADAVLLGPGFTEPVSACSLATRVLEATSVSAYVVDAMALSGLWQVPEVVRRHDGRVVVTPHAGEMASLMGIAREEIERDPQRVATKAASHLGCIVVLKGATTVIAAPGAAAHVHESRLPGLGISGSGDVLAGVLAGLLARGMAPLPAALWSVYLHAQAGRLLSEQVGPLGYLPRDLPEQIPRVMFSRDLNVQSPA